MADEERKATSRALDDSELEDVRGGAALEDIRPRLTDDGLGIRAGGTTKIRATKGTKVRVPDGTKLRK